MSLPASLAPTRILYTMLRVNNLEASVSFYRDMLGMTEMGRETYPDAKFTVAFLGYGSGRDNNPTVELTYNWGDKTYDHGTAFGNLSLAVPDVHALVAYLKQHNVKILREAGVMPIVSTETGHAARLAFISDPDGYKVELMQTA